MSARLNRLVLSTLLVGCAVAAAPNTAAAQDAGAIRTLLEKRDRDIKTVLASGNLTENKRERLKDMINDVIDFEAMGRQALGRHWAGLEEAQRVEFVEVFAEIVRRQSVADLDVYESKVTYTDIAIQGDSARVETVTTYKDTPTTVVYIMGLRGDEWKVRDIVLNEVSTAEGYARSFQSVVRKKGFDTLMSKLRAKRDEMTETS